MERRCSPMPTRVRGIVDFGIEVQSASCGVDPDQVPGGMPTSPLEFVSHVRAFLVVAGTFPGWL